MVRNKSTQEQTSRQLPPFNRSPPRARLGLFLVGRGGGKRSAFDDGWCVRLGEWQTRFLHTMSVVDLERLEHWLDGHLCDNEERDVAKWHEAIVQTTSTGPGTHHRTQRWVKAPDFCIAMQD